jgi:sulfite exporter TauE/SafE
MMVILLGALLVFGGVLYMVRAVIWRGSLSGPDSGRPVRGTLEPRRRGVGFLGLGTNWPGILLIATGAILLLSGIVF